MLRIIVLCLGGLAVAAGALLLGTGARGPGLNLILIGAVILLGTIFERWRYRQAPPRAGAHWQRTAERFVDPATGDTMEVYYDPASGERRYLREGESVAGR
jgi:hypothetical protein